MLCAEQGHGITPESAEKAVYYIVISRNTGIIQAGTDGRFITGR